MIRFEQTGDWKDTERFISFAKSFTGQQILEKYAEDGLNMLKSSTPKDTGETSDSWKYSIINKKDSVSIVYSNSNVKDGVNIAILIQYGHATKSGVWIEGRDYINPALKPVFDQMTKELSEEMRHR